MLSIVVTLILGVVFCVIGLINRTGNITLLHSYHRKRAAEEDKKPMGKLVGLGMLIIGVAMIAFAVLLFVYEKAKIGALIWAGNACLLVGLAVGLVLVIYAIIKYNKGLF